MSEELQQAVITGNNRRPVSLAWIVPLIAIIVTFGLFLQWKLKQGPLVSIEFTNANGLTNESPLMYRGTVVGRVESIALLEDAAGIVVYARLDSSATVLAKENTKWWIVRPSVSLQGVQGLDTIVGPRYIQALPGGGKASYSFTGSDFPVPPAGKLVTLIAASAESVPVGAPLFYRGIEVGEISSIDLGANATTVRLTCIVQQKYAPLVRTNSVFWNVSGIRIDANLLGIDLKAGPITSWIKGGVAFATPNRLGELAPDGFAFTLEQDVDDDWLEWTPEINLSQNSELP